MEFLDGTLMCKTCIQNQRMRPVPPASDPVSVGGMVASAIGGAIGAVAGGGIWAAIAIATNLEVGYIAILVGFLAGMGVQLGAGRRGDQGQQVLAAILAFAGLLAAKYFLFAYVVIQMGAEHGIDVDFIDHALLSRFPAMLAETVGPFDAVFAFIAIAAAVRTAKPDS
ncbi:MAG: hypothetical protein H7138_22155 [Myxococcales bacterium]|nr:hypothetical protein [Myxococcales bacterium]